VDAQDESFVAELADFLCQGEPWVRHLLEGGFSCGCRLIDGEAGWCETYALTSRVSSAERALETARLKLREHLQTENDEERS
jgi:hypothetical protein